MNCQCRILFTAWPPIMTLPFSPSRLSEPSMSFGRVATVASNAPSAPDLNFMIATRGVLHLDVHQAGRRLALHRVDRAHEPLEQVEVVAGLLGHHAAVERPRAVPVVLLVVLLVARPADADRAHDHLAEPPILQRLAGGLDGAVEPVLLHDEQPALVLLGRPRSSRRNRRPSAPSASRRRCACRTSKSR